MPKILIVDDHPDNRYMTQALLSGHGHSVIVGQNGAEGLQLALEHTPDLIVSDILMPQMDGYQFCAAIRGNARLADTPFAFFTATYTDDRDEELAYQIGADIFMRKPLDAIEILHNIRQLLEGGRAAGRAAKSLVPPPDQGTLRLYNERLINKLEKKMFDLEQEIARREAVEAERQRLERQLLQAQKMELLGQLAGGVAHDFNNLLLVIAGNVELAQQELPHGSRPAECLDEARAAANRAADLVRQLLLFSRQQPIEAAPVELNALVERTAKMLRRLLHENIELSVELANENCWLYGDAAQLEQLLLNLCVNARDAMPRGGRLVLSVAPVEGDPARVLLRVADTGTGMPDDVRERIFEPFFTTKPVGEGTGLGLAMVHAIARRHDGQLRCLSAPGSGSTFEVDLPTCPPPRGAFVPGQVVAPAPARGEAILLAEDDEQVRRLTAAMLRREGYEVIETSDGRAAIAAFRDSAPKVALAVLDCVMPAMGGLSAFEEICALQRGIPVIFVSGYSQEIIEADRFAGSAVKFLRKPFTRDELLTAVRQLLDLLPSK